MIEVKSVTRVYQQGSHKFKALDNVSFVIQKGESLAIEGPSGSGKSTLMHLLGGLDTPTSGEILVEGHNLSKFGDKELSQFRNQAIGFVFQTFNLQSYLTAQQNVAVPLLIAGKSYKVAMARAEVLLQRFGMVDRLKYLPKQMSGGEQQRVAVARALANEPNMILADEPTGNLDKDNANTILAMFDEIIKDGTALVVVTHDSAVSKHCKRTIRIEKGEVVKDKNK